MNTRQFVSCTTGIFLLQEHVGLLSVMSTHAGHSVSRSNLAGLRCDAKCRYRINTTCTECVLRYETRADFTLAGCQVHEEKLE